MGACTQACEKHDFGNDDFEIENLQACQQACTQECENSDFGNDDIEILNLQTCLQACPQGCNDMKFLENLGRENVDFENVDFDIIGIENFGNTGLNTINTTTTQDNGSMPAYVLAVVLL